MTMLNKSQQLYLSILKDLHQNWQPHEGQKEVGKPLLNDGKNTIFLQCGRKWGKSEFAVYMLWRWALLNPGSSCYYITPEMSHGKEIVWSNGRLQNFGPKKYLQGEPNNTEMRVRFKNGSFIKILGSENFGAANGLTPAIVVYDEFKEFNPKFHEVMNPNRMVKSAPLLIIGTPPKIDDKNRDQYVTYAEECKEREDSVHLRHTSYKNPHISHEGLDMEKERLIARGEPDVWYREYEALIVAGGKRAVFPMLDREKHVQRFEDVYKSLRRDLKKLEWFVAVDPGSATCCATLFGAINPYNKKVYILDEIYEKDQCETSVRRYFPRIEKITKYLYPPSSIEDDWVKVYDEAALWFSNEVMNQFEVYFMPTAKHLNKKEDGISLIKDTLLFETIVISDRCENLLWEMENYITDDNGKYVKKNDHLIDCLRYLLGVANYSMVEVMEAIRVKDEMERGRSLEQDLNELRTENTWEPKIFNWEEY
jgi:hypothetical protein